MKTFLAKVFRKKSFKALLLIILILIFWKAYVKINNLVLRPTETEVSVEEFLSDITKISYNENLEGYGKVHDPDVSVTWGISENFKKIKEEDRVLEIRLSNLIFRRQPDQKKHGEIKVLVKTFLYMRSHKIPIDIIGFELVYRRIMSGDAILYITTEELEELYEKVYLEGEPENAQIEILVDRIIKESGYERNGFEHWISKKN